MTDQQAPGGTLPEPDSNPAPSAEAPAETLAAPSPAAPAPAVAPSGWVVPPPPPPVAPPPGAWVMPAAQVTRGPVTGLAKLGALVLLVFGVLWGLGGVLLIVVGGAIRDQFDFTQNLGLTYDVGNVLTGVLLAVGIVILVIALGEILTAIFAWRGNGLARVVGIVYGLLFGLGSLSIAARSTSADVAGSAAGALFMAVFAVGYLYTVVVFMFRWRRRA